MKSKMIPPIPKETLVGVQGTVGAFRVKKRFGINLYWVEYGTCTTVIRRGMLVHPLPAGRYLLNGEAENFVTV